MTINPTYNLWLSFMIAFVSLAAFGQGKMAVTQLDKAQLPKEIKYEGTIQMAVRWTDNLGDNIVLLTETGIHKSKKFNNESDGRDAELFAYHFTIKDNSAVQTWRVYDFVADCPVDIEAQFIKNTFQVTDLNKDGIGEIWMVYETACHGDVSPSIMKIMMYQGQQKHAMRGEREVLVGKDDKGKEEYIGGGYKFDTAFAKGPKEFLEFAKKLWDKNRRQTWGE